MTVRGLLVLPLVAALALAGCEAEPKWDILPDGSCDPAQLQVRLVPRVDDDPELVVIDVLIKNISRTECTLGGVPTVTITDAYESKPIGAPAVAMPGDIETVDVAPDTYVFMLLQTRKSLADTPTCIGVLANSTRILLPGRTDAEAIVTSAPVAKYCDEPSRGTFLVSPITARALEVPGVEDFVANDF